MMPSPISSRLPRGRRRISHVRPSAECTGRVCGAQRVAIGFELGFGMTRLPHTSIERNSLGPSAVVCGDPKRASEIAALLDGAELIGDSREFRIYSGEYRGVSIAVASHGIGAPGAAI